MAAELACELEASAQLNLRLREIPAVDEDCGETQMPVCVQRLVLDLFRDRDSTPQILDRLIDLAVEVGTERGVDKRDPDLQSRIANSLRHHLGRRQPPARLGGASLPLVDVA